MKMLRYFFFISISIIIQSCSTVRIIKFDQISRPAKIDGLDVYTGRESIRKPYKEIALITVDDNGWNISETDLLQKLILKAKDIGADGIIILIQDNQSKGGVFVNGVFVQSNRRIVRGSAIEYIDSE